MLLNLAINARDAMPEGGKLSIATRLIDDIPASLQAELQPGRYVCISVTDSGTGMSPSVVERAFEPFFTTKEPGKGTGLGLSQLYGFAKQSGGTARIESVEGKGTVVSIYLPCTERSGKDRAKPALAHPDEQNGRILLVDDDDDVRAAATAILQELGYEVTSAEHASRALELLDGSQFDLVLTDVVMPGMGGVELARRIAARTPDLPILFATGYADLDDFADSLDNTMIVRKPFRMAELAARIAAARSAPERVGR
jgi:CheY-like chemotaxis protein